MRLRSLVIVIAVVAACGDNAPEQIATAPESMSVTGPFDDGAPIPARYTCDGEDQSPALQWERAPEADGCAVVMTDIDADGFVHWMAWNIPANVTNVETGEEPAGAVVGTNSFGDTGYGGPCPPSATSHTAMSAPSSASAAIPRAT